MDKKQSQKKCTDQDSACEIIELTINEINTLAAAFNSINSYCLSVDEVEEEIPSGIPDIQLH